MASIDLTPHDLVVHIHGIDRLLALRSHLSVPLAHVTGVREHAAEAFFDDAVVDSSRGIGIFLRGQVAAGSLQLADGRAFYDVHDPHKAIVIDLEAERFEHLVVEVDDEPPDAAADRIRDALARRLAARGVGPRAEATYRAIVTTLPETGQPPDAEPPHLPAWKRAIAAAGAIAFIPVAAIAFVFLAPALVPILLFGLPGTSDSKES
jgi:hypothetical protein